MGEGDWADWPIVRPVVVVQTTVPFLECLVVFFCTKANADY